MFWIFLVNGSSNWYVKSIFLSVFVSLTTSLTSGSNDFELLESVPVVDLDDGYELRHHVINCFDLLLQIFDNKSDTPVRQDLFEDSITYFRDMTDEVIIFISKNMK